MHTRGLAQKEEQLLGVSSHYSIKQPSADTLSAARTTELHPGWTKAWDSRKWPNPNRQFGTVYLGPSNQFIPNTRRTCHGLGWPLFVLMHQLSLWINFGHDILTHRRCNFDCSRKRKLDRASQKNSYGSGLFQNCMKPPRRMHCGRESPVPVGMGPPGGLPAQAGDLRNSVLAFLVVDLISYGRGNNVRVLNLLVC